MHATREERNNSGALIKALGCLLENVGPGKHWCDFQEEWNPIITCITAELLLDCGLDPDTPWHVKREHYLRYTLREVFTWLDHCVTADGAFGTDFWDAARLGNLVEKHKLQSSFPSYERLRCRLLKTIDTAAIGLDGSVWNGPGFLAVATDYLDSLGKGSQGDALVQRLLSLQVKDGSWQGVLGPDGHPVVSPVWHTAQVVLVLSRRGRADYRAAVNRGIDWLRKTQENVGCWPGVQQYLIYFTAYAVLALLKAESPDRVAIGRAAAYLKSRMAADGKCSDLGGTLMCAVALKAVIGDSFEHDVTLIDCLLARTNICRLEFAEAALSQTAADKDELARKLKMYEDKYRDADVVLTKRQLLLIALLSLLFTAVGTAVGVFALVWALGRPSL